MNVQKAAGIVLALGLAIGPGCREKPSGTEAADKVLTREAGDGTVNVSMSVTPSLVAYSRDNLLTITTVAPAGIEVSLPPLDDRLKGFVLNGAYADEPVLHAGTVTRAHHARLTPVIAQRQRIAPIPVTYTDSRVAPASSGWFPTPPIDMQLRPAASDETPSDIDDGLAPVWIFPPLSTVALTGLWVLLAVGLLAGAVVLASKLRRKARLARLSPRERALRELEELLARKLIAAGRVKDFYLELTMVVRRYIERTHAVRAPEQTTEEFLEAVAGDPRFAPEVLRRLKDFLQAADLVKFAAHRPDNVSVENAVATARVYIQTDADRAEQAGDTGRA